MQSEIKEMFYFYIEQAEVKRSKTFSELCDKLDKIQNGLDENQKKLFDEIYDTLSGMMAEEDYAHFKLGFNLGLKLAMESVFNL